MFVVKICCARNTIASNVLHFTGNQNVPIFLDQWNKFTFFFPFVLWLLIHDSNENRSGNNLWTLLFSLGSNVNHQQQQHHNNLYISHALYFDLFSLCDFLLLLCFAKRPFSICFMHRAFYLIRIDWNERPNVRCCRFESTTHKQNSP